MKYSFLLLSILFFAGCSSNKKQSMPNESPDGIPVIDLSANVLKVQSLPLSDAAAKVEIVPLEVTDESMLGSIHSLHVTDQDIWVDQYKDEYIYRFSRTGKFLNKVGKIGQGPEEYVQCSDFLVDEYNKELYLTTTTPAGIKVYDYNGNFKRTASQRVLDRVFMTVHSKMIYYDNKFFLTQRMPFWNDLTLKDSIWSFALADSSLFKKKLFKNPAHIGREEEILKNGVSFSKFINKWGEPNISIDTYDNQLTLKYPDTDTIYQYDNAKDELIPQYTILTNEAKGDYGATHAWIRDRSSFDYFNISYYYPSKDYIYLLCNKGESVYTYCYDRRDGSVRVKELKSEILEKPARFGLLLGLKGSNRFLLDNDLCGGPFHVEFRTQGKYWVDVLEPGSTENWIDVDAVKVSAVKDEARKQKFVSTLENVEDEANPILIIATLK